MLQNINYYLEEKEYKIIGLCSGSGEEYGFMLKDIDVFLTGEIKYHTALEFKRQNISFNNLNSFIKITPLKISLKQIK